MSGKLLWKSRTNAVSVGCLGCGASQAPHTLSVQVWVPVPQVLVQVWTTGATSHAPHRLLAQVWVPVPQVLVHGPTTGATWQIPFFSLSQSWVPWPQSLLQGSWALGMTHAFHCPSVHS